MPATSFAGLALVALVGFAVPLVLGFVPALRLPSVVFEIVVGILIGPSVLHWVTVDQPIAIVSLIGLALLLFLSGLELDLDRLRGRVLRVTGLAFLLSFVIALTRTERSMRLSTVLLRLQDTTAQIRVRGAFVLLVAFAAFAERLGLEVILGTFIAGAILALVDRDQMMTHGQFRTKLEAVGFGVFIPIFFVTSGIRFDLA